MRLGWLINSVNAWFERVVYERDVFDTWLSDSIEGARVVPQPHVPDGRDVRGAHETGAVAVDDDQPRRQLHALPGRWSSTPTSTRRGWSVLEDFKKTCRQLPNLVVGFSERIGQRDGRRFASRADNRIT